MACGGAHSVPLHSAEAAHEVSADDAKRAAAGAVEGAMAGEANREDEKDEHVWRVNLTLASGAIFVAEVDRKSGTVIEVVGTKAPYDYDFAPKGLSLRFADARSKALGAKSGEIKEWELDLEKVRYEFEIQGSDGKLYAIKIDARTGIVTSPKGR